MKQYTDILASAGYALSEEDQILYILSGLGIEYDPVMVTLTSKPEAYSLKDVCALLQSFEMRLEHHNQPRTTDGSLSTANLAFNSQNKKNKKNYPNRFQNNNSPNNPNTHPNNQNFQPHRGGRRRNPSGRGCGGRD